jgi:uncharacterized protein YqeY
MAKAAIQNAEIANRSPLSEDDVMSVLSREVKTRRESLGEFERGGRPELAAKEAQALDVLSRYMPAQLSEEDIRQIVTETIEQLDVTIPTNPQAALGTVMKAVMPKVRGRADGSAVSSIVRATLHR